MVSNLNLPYGVDVETKFRGNVFFDSFHKVHPKIQSKYEEEKKKIDDELQAVKNLIGNTEDEYIKWEQKVAKIASNADREEARIKTAKERFERWRIGVLEEVARLKLKSKVDKIDKAGLSEILNG